MPTLPPSRTPAFELQSDTDIWPAILSGNSKAWSVLVRRYEALVYAVACRCGLSMTEAGDCFQQTWLLLYKNRARIKDPARLHSWLATTAKREAIRLKKVAGKDPEREEIPEQVDRTPLPDQLLEDLEMQGALEGALSALEPRCASLLKAVFFETQEISYDDIARKLGLAANSIGPTRRRCLEKLRLLLVGKI